MSAGAPDHRVGVDLFAKVADPRLDQWRQADAEGFLPYYRELDGRIGPVVEVEGQRLVMLGSNNYLGLTTDERVQRAAIAAVERYGTGVTGSRLLNGTLDLHRQLEDELADWVGQEAALVFTTGYGANLGLLSALIGATDVAVLDSAAHASLVDGARMAEGTLRAFRHNRPNSLRRTLRSLRSSEATGGVLVAVDGIYSMEGDWAPLADVGALCAEFGARLLVDEAHSLGVVGPAGAGTAAAAGVRPDLVMGTFSKALASCGGFVAGPAAVIDFLKITCRPLLFTASGVPAALGAALAATRVARSEGWRREAVAARAAQLHRGLTELGYAVGPATDSAIVPLHVDDVVDAGLLWRELKANGVYTNCVIPPAVARPLLRTSVMATHTEADIDRALEGFARCRVPPPGTVPTAGPRGGVPAPALLRPAVVGAAAAVAAARPEG
ncbi:MAG TPA: aminotransferase class I/II-fold pyridoxal phosphate-dependent enzyme [Acidimicrobiales bacterium]|nr:aminotransferase class I/II-fold pyridoxal phosphate-dependent enzyme [Acidimicrobiales bacterium]